MLSRLSCALLLSLVAVPLVAQSNDTLTVAPGARLRVLPRAGSWLPVGTFERQTPDSLVVFLDCSMCGGVDSTIAWRDVRMVKRYMGRQHGKGALVGLLVGTAVGFVAAKVAIHDCEQRAGADLCGLNGVVAPLGSAAGLLLGAAIGTERWVTVWADASKR
jgi:hypothetical protein